MMTPTTSHTILVVDDRADIRLFLRKVIEDMGYRCEQSSSGEEALNRVSQIQPVLVFMDVQMLGMSGLEALTVLKSRYPELPVVIITANGTMDVAIQAMQKGAFDYITKPLALDAVQTVIRQALQRRNEIKHDSNGSKEHGSAPASAVSGVSFSTTSTEEFSVVGKSKAMQEVFKRIGLISTTPNHSSVLIHGESGTGKEMIARAIHANSANAAQPFVGINCTAIPEHLLESELFGSERGSYTGSTQRRIGKFEYAGEGTIFLDEIGDLSLSLQAKLLRVLQERVIERVGGNEQIAVKARFITATHRSLPDEVRAGRFREDLFYRLNIVTVDLPPLRERRGDILVLAEHFVQKYNRLMNRAITGFSDEARALLEAYHFPGNVRELENIIERAFIFTTGTTILPSTLGIAGLDSHNAASSTAQAARPRISSRVYAEARETALADFEREFLQTLLAEHEGNVTAAAQEAQLTRQYFHRMMQRYDITADVFRKRDH
jgi:DNA-binding NtrC family response regulator